MNSKMPIYLIVALGLVGLSACDRNEGPAEEIDEAGQAIEDSVDDAGDKLEEAGEEIEDEVDDAT